MCQKTALCQHYYLALQLFENRLWETLILDNVFWHDVTGSHPPAEKRILSFRIFSGKICLRLQVARARFLVDGLCQSALA
jgi:hypothetical protein